MMGFIQGLKKRMPSTASLPSLPDINNEKSRARLRPRLSFFKKRVPLSQRSNVTVPMGAVLSFPLFIIIVIIIVVVVWHPTTPGSLMMPAGAPPAIR